MSVFNQKEKFWYGPEYHRNSIYNPNNSVGEVIFNGLKNSPDRVSQINDENGGRMTCETILELSVCVAESLKGLGFKVGDVFSVISRNNEDLASVVFGSLFLGATLNTLDVTLDENDLLHIFDTVKPKLIFVDPISLTKILSCLNSLKLGTKIILFTSDETSTDFTNVRTLYTKPEICSTFPFTPAIIQHPEASSAFVVCSSGITGPNKMVCMSHSQIISELLRLWDWSITASDTVFTFSSLFWVSGLANLLIATVKGATRVITTKPYSSDTLFELVKKHKITQICLPNACISDVLSNKRIETDDLATLRTVVIGGSTVFDRVKDELQMKLERNGTKVVEVYGFIELGSLSTNTLYGKKKGSVGIVATQNLLRIVNKKGKSLGPGEVGEICAKNDCQFLGYYNNEELTKQTVDSNGWIRSGDLGYFDDEGFLYIKGKIKELIKRKGITISPEAIESILQQKTGILKICAIRIEDGRQEDDLPAVVINRPPDHPLKEEEIVEMAHEALVGDFALTGGIYFVNEFPMTPSGKVKRGALKELANGWYKEQLKKLEKERRKNEPAPMYFLS